jgi:arabinogalactan endo-1,4-beta-galactosidase
MMNILFSVSLSLALFIITESCKKSSSSNGGNTTPPQEDTFYFGADLSYVNQVLDHGGVYKDQGEVRNPYRIFKNHGTTLARFRLWHHPLWAKEIYGSSGTQLYNDLADVEKSIRLAKEQGMAVELDFHYSDTWADPGKQEIPKAWIGITNLSVLKDSVYQYTLKTLQYLDSKGLMPEMIQLGNEINCGMFFTNAPANFPAANSCNGDWQKLGEILNSGIRAVREVAATSSVKPKILLHVADPKNVDWWFSNITSAGNVHDFDIIGFSYYPLWHTTVPVEKLSDNIFAFKSKFSKDVMILETAYPWIATGNDSYNNVFGTQPPVTGYPYSVAGQFNMMKAITQEIIDGKGSGIIYWEPAWISSSMKDLWGTGSSWENAAFFDFNGNAIQGIDFMKHLYQY